jgi:hypothetical protein
MKYKYLCPYLPELQDFLGILTFPHISLHSTGMRQVQICPSDVPVASMEHSLQSIVAVTSTLHGVSGHNAMPAVQRRAIVGSSLLSPRGLPKATAHLRLTATGHAIHRSTSGQTADSDSCGLASSELRWLGNGVEFISPRLRRRFKLFGQQLWVLGLEFLAPPG